MPLACQLSTSQNGRLHHHHPRDVRAHVSGTSEQGRRRSPPHHRQSKVVRLGSFLVACCLIIFSLLGWRDHTGDGAATAGTYYFSGGRLAIISCIFELILANTCPETLSGVFGGYCLSVRATLTPSFAAFLTYEPDRADPPAGVTAPPFLSGMAFCNLMVTICTIYCTGCPLRVNTLFCAALFFRFLTFILTFASYWTVTEAGKQMIGDVDFAERLRRR
ncbi:hypothetical protein CERZMDRAFT_97022 [Cercospora zeae-maydis SCOH1-5]|uniref:Uncharacterized protein n=1 Tax=Cercospora zeae-maydis SCOH1-5 TaxID=717836 RepID=A0A6A6FGW4_9PEZI|nr:hypothetical protein CERZMDRAFT_97022 [Cercospora zeae-maydis SCOH1-5]